MCDPVSMGVAQMALSVVATVGSHQQKNAQADAQEARNQQAMRDADRVMLEDQSRIDAQRVAINEEESRAKADLRREARAEIGEGLVSNWANPHAIMRDIGTSKSFDYIDIQADADKDRLSLFRKQDEISASRDRRYNSLIAPQRPSQMGLGIGLAKAGLTFGNAAFGAGGFMTDEPGGTYTIMEERIG